MMSNSKKQKGYQMTGTLIRAAIVASLGGLAIPFIFGGAMMIVQFFVVWFFFVETKGVPFMAVATELNETH